ncbi:MAG TPA: hypothetical protein VJI71_02675 [Candidatus Norongarragalinales archaeon]|nr:hypothetical protein [Candidatus Norongarragalinales archaeon]
MAEIDSVVKKWGNSFGVLLSKDVVKREGLSENAHVHVIIARPTRVLKKTFGSLSKKLKLSGQEVKNLAREELYG